MTTRKTRAQERADAIDISPATLLAQIEELSNQLVAANTQSDEYLSALQRERAEFLNYKRRTAEERQRDLGLAGDDLIRKVLAVADDFDRAIDARPQELAGNSWAEGIAVIDRKLRSLLESEGVTEIDAAPGRRFDPREHEAIANVPDTDRPEGEIVDEVRRGYRLRDRVLRPALVAVAAPANETEPSPQPETRAN
jgi:molecular chaperone GrpE